MAARTRATAGRNIGISVSAADLGPGQNTKSCIIEIMSARHVLVREDQPEADKRPANRRGPLDLPGMDGLAAAAAGLAGTLAHEPTLRAGMTGPLRPSLCDGTREHTRERATMLRCLQDFVTVIHTMKTQQLVACFFALHFVFAPFQDIQKFRILRV